MTMMLSMASLIIETFVCNPYQQSTYVVHVEGQSSCIVVDAGMYDDEEQGQFDAYLRDNHLTIAAVLVTHAHPDHVCGLDWIKHTYGVTTVIDAAATEEQREIAGLHIEMLRTPGHKEDCVCFAVKPVEANATMQDAAKESENDSLEGKKELLPVLFSGDTLFRQSVGRTDLPGGNYRTLMQSLRQLMTLPDDMIVYPGHGEPTTISYERKFNPFV